MGNTTIELKSKSKTQRAEEEALKKSGELFDSKTPIEGYGKLPRPVDSMGSKKTTPEDYHIPGMQMRARQAGNKISQDLIIKWINRNKPTMAELFDWLEAPRIGMSKGSKPFIGNKGGVVNKKTKGFKHGGLAGQGHNDMRKGGLFK